MPLGETYRGSFLSPKTRRQIISWMKGQQVDTRFGTVLGDGELSLDEISEDWMHTFPEALGSSREVGS